MCGSTGLCGVTEASLNITPIPRYRTLVNVKYDSPLRAQKRPFMVQAHALSVETVDSRVLGLARADIIWHSVKDLIQDVPGGSAGSTSSSLPTPTRMSTRQGGGAVPTSTVWLARGEAGVIGYQVCDHLPSIETIYGMRKKSVGCSATPRAQEAGGLHRRHRRAAGIPGGLHHGVSPCWTLTVWTHGMFGHVDAGCCTCARRWTCAILSRRVRSLRPPHPASCGEIGAHAQ